MKRIVASVAALLLIAFMTSCSENINKKPVPESTKPQVTQDDSQKQVPAGNTAKEPEKQGNDNTDSTKSPGYQYSSGENTSQPGTVNTNTAGLSNEKISQWMPGTNKVHKTPVLNPKFKTLLDKYGGYFTGDSSSKVIYLTFDEGYENGYTGQILDILKANDVKAAFFVTRPYIKSSPDLVKRMVQEGHIVGNHSSTHPSMPDVSDEKVIKELTDTANYFKEITGYDMPKFFRPPMGEWSERTLYLTNSLGYKTILWSMAHKDWDPNQQPGKEASYKFVDTYYHNGAILLLHAVSKSNTEALDSILKDLEGNGYRFAPLSELK